MKRSIIQINEDLCNGCGVCVQGCPEGALQIIDGKARLVGEMLCDGLGACIGRCPTGALTVIEADAVAYDEALVMEKIVAAGPNVIAAHLAHLKDHGQKEYLQVAMTYLKDHGIAVADGTEQQTLPCGCPGTMQKDFRTQSSVSSVDERSPVVRASQLQQWPVQLKLLNPQAPVFENAELLIAADCVPFAYPSFHERFLKGKSVVIFCPKLDSDGAMYVEKLAEIMRVHTIRSLLVVRMEVPCCGGATRIAVDAVAASGKHIPIREYVISIRGEIV